MKENNVHQDNTSHRKLSECAQWSKFIIIIQDAEKPIVIIDYNNIT